jgi:hypothetical protein
MVNELAFSSNTPVRPLAKPSGGGVLESGTTHFVVHIPWVVQSSLNQVAPVYGWAEVVLEVRFPEVVVVGRILFQAETHPHHALYLCRGEQTRQQLLPVK